MDFISSESHSDQEIPKYISSNKESEITEVTKKKKLIKYYYFLYLSTEYKKNQKTKK